MCLPRYSFRNVLAAALLAALAASAPAYAQQSEFGNMVNRVAALIGDASRGDTEEPRVLVFAFPEKRGPISGFGEFFAVEFCVALAQIAPHIKPIEHEALQEYLVRQKIMPSAQLDPETGEDAARALGARYLVMGRSERKRDFMNLHIDVYDSLRGRKIGEVKGKLRISGDFEMALSSLAHDYSLDSPLPPKDKTKPNQPFKAGKGGIGYPECTFCPNPRFPEEYGKAGFQGTVLLEATIDAEGRAHDIKVQKSLRPELDKNAIEAVRSWRFKPARTKDGQPVPVRVVIEVTFRLLK